MSITQSVEVKAANLIKLYGDQAPTLAAIRADEMRQNGRLYERRTWRRILEEVERQLAAQPSNVAGRITSPNAESRPVSDHGVGQAATSPGPPAIRTARHTPG